jgi:hypothetical protein
VGIDFGCSLLLGGRFYDGRMNAKEIFGLVLDAGEIFDSFGCGWFCLLTFSNLFVFYSSCS